VTTPEQPAILTVVRGNPTDDEVAALVMVIAVSAAETATVEPDPVGGWSDPQAAVRAPVTVGPGSWVAAGRVRGSRTRAAW